MLSKQLLDACDVVFEIAKAPSGTSSTWYVVGYLANAAPNEQRPITQRGEIGSNATILLIDEGQRGMSFQRLNVARVGGSAPHNKNFPAMVKWIVTAPEGDTPPQTHSPEKIMIDMDNPAFATPFDVRKTYFTMDREDSGSGATPVAKMLYRNAIIAQLGIGIGASSKYMEDGISLTWEITEVEDIDTKTTTENSDEDTVEVVVEN